MDLDTPALRRLQIVRQKAAPHRRHYVTAEDVKVVLSRLPEELWSQLRKVHLNDRAKGRRTLGYTTVRGRREVSLCALPIRVSLNGVKCKPETFGALRGSQWPVLAVRRFMLYDVLLHELGHLQVILPDSRNPNRKFASETKAQKFANEWRRQLWSTHFDHPDPVHNPPDEVELQLLKAGWIESNLWYKRGLDKHDPDKPDAAAACYEQALAHYPYHALALEGLGRAWRSIGCNDDNREAMLKSIEVFRRAIAIDPALPDAHLYLALALSQVGDRAESRQVFERAMELDSWPCRAMGAFGDELIDWGCYDKAEKLLKKTVGRRPTWSQGLRFYARLLLLRSEKPPEADVREAIDLLHRALRENVEPMAIQFFLGLGYSMLAAEREKAIHHFREVLRLCPDHKNAARHLAKLTKNEATQG